MQYQHTGARQFPDIYVDLRLEDLKVLYSFVHKKCCHQDSNLKQHKTCASVYVTRVFKLNFPKTILSVHQL